MSASAASQTRVIRAPSGTCSPPGGPDAVREGRAFIGAQQAADDANALLKEMAEEDLAYDFALSIASDADALPLSMEAVA